RAVAEGLAKEAGERDLALQPFELDSVVREFEDAGLARFGIFCEPDFARTGRTHFAGEAPVLAAGDGITGLEAEIGPKSTGDGFALHGDGEAITDARDGEDGELIF